MLLPYEEAASTLQEIVRWLLNLQERPSWRRMPITGNPNDPEFTSGHQYLLFFLYSCCGSLLRIL